MYASIRLPWSSSPSLAETAYKSAGLTKTQGTIFLLPPSPELLIESFNAPPRSKSRMSAGAVALCKHFERGGASSEHGRNHPFWPLPKGSNDNKTLMAAKVLEKMLSDAQWKNVMILHPGVAVYEIRNSLGYGMRWTLLLVQPSTKDPVPGENSRMNEEDIDQLAPQDRSTPADIASTWSLSQITFRGFLEPIIGLDHELPSQSAG